MTHSVYPISSRFFLDWCPQNMLLGIAACLKVRDPPGSSQFYCQPQACGKCMNCPRSHSSVKSSRYRLAFVVVLLMSVLMFPMTSITGTMSVNVCRWVFFISTTFRMSLVPKVYEINLKGKNVTWCHWGVLASYWIFCIIFSEIKMKFKNFCWFSCQYSIVT